MRSQNNTQLLAWRQNIRAEDSAKIQHELVNNEFHDAKFYQGRFGSQFRRSMDRWTRRRQQKF